MSEAQIIDGKQIAATVRAEVAAEVARLQKEHGLKPGLAVELVGEDPASKVYGANNAKQTVEVGMKSWEHRLPVETSAEFVDILPFTQANSNYLIGWIAGRSDGAHYGNAIVYDFPKTKLVDGPLQIEARIDQNAQISGQLTLWNQQGSHVRRGSLLVIPIGRALLYAEPIYLQAERSPMPELRLVVLALQDKLAYGPSYEAALTSLFGGGSSSLTSTGKAIDRCAWADSASREGSGRLPTTHVGRKTGRSGAETR